jgi:hypothetical protein
MFADKDSTLCPNKNPEAEFKVNRATKSYVSHRAMKIWKTLTSRNMYLKVKGITLL